MTTSRLVFACYWTFREGNVSSLILLTEDYRLIPDESRHRLCMKFSIIASYHTHFIGIKTYLPIFGRKILTTGYFFLNWLSFTILGLHLVKCSSHIGRK